MKKVLFLLSAVLIVAFSIIACQKDNNISEVIPVPDGSDVVTDRADCTNVQYSIVASQLGTGDYGRITYTNSSNVVTTITLNSTTCCSGFFTIKAGTSIGFKHRLTCNTGAFPNYIKTRLISNGVTKDYKYKSDGSGIVKNWLCSQADCTLSTLLGDSCDSCTDIPYTAPDTTPNYWCN